MRKENDVTKYVQFYSTTLGQKILERETRFVSERLRGCRNVLSIGCGPALLEAKLERLHPEMTIIGLDASKEMITQAPKGISVMYGDAQHLEFQDSSFDAVLYITSLEFIENIQKAIQETSRVLKRSGLLLVLLLNPNSQYFQKKYSNQRSYLRKYIKHRDINRIQQVISQYFSITQTSYFLGITKQDINERDDQSIASLYVLEGEKLCLKT